MPLKVHNTLSGKPDEIVPGGARKEDPSQYPPVTIYSCGPTVYGHAHIGNFRTFVFNDFLRRYLKFRGFRVDHAMNVTDVDDKTIAGARAEGITLRQYTDRYASLFFEDLASLNIEPVEHVPRATESVEAMIDIITRLADRGLTYEREGSLYFCIDKFHKYGRLSRLDRRETRTGLRYDTDEYEKDDVRDFALWKAPKDDAEEAWDTPFGRGRPGWHIECSAMVRKIFGTTIDIHTGGVDLIFPHHENEIAQSEGAYDEPFVRHWIHVEHLLVDGAKMSKSKGNFYTLRDLVGKGHSPRAIRYLLVTAHYRKQLNFTLAGLAQAGQALSRIDNLLVRLADLRPAGEDNPGLPALIRGFFEAFSAAVDDDLNVSGGMAAFFDFLHAVNGLISEESLSAADRGTIEEALRKIDSVLGVIYMKGDAEDPDAARIDALVKERLQARAERNFARADEIRKALLDEGVILEDTKDGTRWKRKN